MKPNFEDVCLGLLTIQGFFVMFWEWQVYRIHSERFKERAKWRESKRASLLKKKETETATSGSEKPTESPSKNTPSSEATKVVDVKSAAGSSTHMDLPTLTTSIFL